MKKSIQNWFKERFTSLDKSWLPVREFIKKWCITSFLVLVALLVTDREYVNFACHILQANITGDPSLTGSERFALGALLHYPSFIFRALQCGAYVIFVLTSACIVIFDFLHHHLRKTRAIAPGAGKDTTPEAPDV